MSRRGRLAPQRGGGRRRRRRRHPHGGPVARRRGRPAAMATSVANAHGSYGNTPPSNTTTAAGAMTAAPGILSNHRRRRRPATMATTTQTAATGLVRAVTTAQPRRRGRSGCRAQITTRPPRGRGQRHATDHHVDRRPDGEPHRANATVVPNCGQSRSNSTAATTLAAATVSGPTRPTPSAPRRCSRGGVTPEPLPVPQGKPVAAEQVGAEHLRRGPCPPTASTATAARVAETTERPAGWPGCTALGQQLRRNHPSRVRSHSDPVGLSTSVPARPGWKPPASVRPTRPSWWRAHARLPKMAT
jgi:hypothetical protein